MSLQENSNQRKMATPTKTQTIDDLITEKKMHKLTSPTMKTKLTGESNHWSLISLNVNRLNSPIKRYRLPADGGARL